MKKKIYIVLIVIIIMITFFNANCFASDVTAIYNGTTDSRISTPVATILGIIQAIGYASAIVMLTYVGIKYILATPDGKAELKKQLVPYIIGIILLFSGSTLAVIIGNIAKTI